MSPGLGSDCASPDVPRVTAAALVGVLTVLAASLHFLIQSHRPLWLDEACTYWTVQIPALDVLRGARTDGTPPLHFLLVAGAIKLFGSSEVSLRLVSIAAATALVPACYRVARLFARRRTALVAAAFTAVSPLVHYYSIEARSYALVQLETVFILYAILRSLAAPERLRWWGLLALTLAFQLWTHNYGSFVLAATPLLFLVAAPRNRVKLALYAAAASAVAAVLAAPPLLSGLRSSSSGVPDWIGEFWRQTPPAAAILRSLEVFGFGGAYPPYLPSLGSLPDVRPVSIALTATLLIVAVAPVATRTRRLHPEVTSLLALLTFLLLPLCAAWLYSALVQPVYLVGRYDTIVLPAFLILMGVGLDRLLRARWWIGAPVVVVVLWLGVTWFAAVARNTTYVDTDERLAAAFIAEHAKASDPIVTTGFRRAVFAYYLDRAAHPAMIFSFPSEVAEHPGWYRADRLLADPASLARDGANLAKELISRAQQGQSVWILSSDPSEVDTFLYRDLSTALTIDNVRSRQDLQVLCLRLK
jgi:hypothetical protein